MFSENQSFFPAAKTNLESQLALFNALNQAAIRNTEKIIGFNMNATKANWEKSTASTKQLLATQNLQERLSLAATQSRESLEAAVSYQRGLLDMMHAARDEFSNVFMRSSAVTAASQAESATPKSTA